MAEEDSEDALSFYALLNVSREASDEDIKRAFRTLAQTYHPDKQQDEERKAVAAASFTRIQEAYEVLIDAERRQVYDIYGKEGLASGLEVGAHLRTHEELRAQWQQFQQQQKAGHAAQQQDERMDYRGAYMIKVDASPLFDTYDPHMRHAPDVISTASSPTVSVSLSPKNSLTVGVQTVTKRGVGGSSFVAGYRRILTPDDSVEAHVMLGLKTLVQMQSTRQLGEHASATLATTWQPELGFGLQLGTARQLSTHWHGEGTWVVGPRVASGLGVGLTRRDEKSVFTCKLDVGVGAGVSARYVRSLTERSTGRISGRFGATGVELELGASRRLGHSASMGLYVAVGLAGITLKATAARRGQQLQVPIMLSHRPDDWRVLAGAYVLPPLLGAVLRYGVVGPLLRRHRLQQALQRRRDGLVEVRQLIAEAGRAAELMRPVAARKTSKAAAEGGLVIVEAVFGRSEAMPPVGSVAAGGGASAAAPSGTSAAVDTASDADSTEPGGADSQPSTQPRAHPLDSDAEDDAASLSGSEGSSPPAAAAAEAERLLAAAGELPPQWLDVTVAVRFLAEPTKLVLHRGVRKAGLMGFCEVAPGEMKQLRVAYLAGGRPHTIMLSDAQAATLPDDGQLVTDGDVKQRILAAAGLAGKAGDDEEAA